MERARIIIREGDGGGLKVMGERGTVPHRHMDNYLSPFPLAYSFLSLCSRYMFAYTRLQGARVDQCIRYHTKAEKTGTFPPFHSSQLRSIHSSVLECWWPYVAYTVLSRVHSFRQFLSQNPAISAGCTLPIPEVSLRWRISIAYKFANITW
jgi:hypothetical protein